MKTRGRPRSILLGRIVQDLKDKCYRAALWYRLYGIEFILLYILGCQQVWCMIHQLIQKRKPKLFAVFRTSQQSENAAMAVAGTIIATIALASIILPSITKIHWIARALWLFSLLSGLIAVLCACNQQIAVSRRITCQELFKWMNDDSRAANHEQSEAIAGKQKEFAVPDVLAVVLISLPRKFLHYSFQAYMIGLAVYLGLLWRDQLEEAAPEDNKNIFLFFMISLVVCWIAFTMSDITNRCKGSVWRDDYTEVNAFLSRPGEACIGVKESKMEEELCCE